MPQRETRLIGGVYRTGQVINAGGMLTISTAYNHNTNDVVGLYVINLSSPEQLPIAQQLLQVFERRRAVQSPHVIHVHNWGSEGYHIYIATDPPRGVTLQHVLDTENIDLRRSIDLTRQLALGLKALHEQGIAGLDLRPQLITVDTIGVADRVQIDDIGLRILLQRLGYNSSQRGDDIGYLDPRYAPPEYINGGRVGLWSDIYQLGLLLFTLVTGRLPFVGGTAAETGVLQSTGPVPSMATYKHGTPPEVQRLVEHILAKDPAQRPLTIDALLSALAALPLPRSPRATETLKGAQEKAGTKSSASLTKEIPLTGDDIALQETVIGDQNAATSAAPSLPLQNEPRTTGVYAYLCHEKAGSELRRFPITQKNVIVGRLDPKRDITPDIDLSTVDPTMTISRQHARIRCEETFFYIEDLKSRNKTRLGELLLSPLKAELLQHGDSVQFGSVRLTFEVPGQEKPPAFKDRK